MREVHVRRGGDPVAAPQVTVRLDQRASDAVLAGLLGIEGPRASVRLTGVSEAAGWAVADLSPSTAWITPFDRAEGARLIVPTPYRPIPTLAITQPDGGLLAHHGPARE